MDSPVNVFNLPATALLDIRGGAGDDMLSLASLSALQGQIFFDGGEGNDSVLVDGSSSTSAASLLLLPIGWPWPRAGEGAGALTQTGGGLYYAAETLDISLTPQNDSVWIYGTAPGTESVILRGLDGNDTFYVQPGYDGSTLADIHAQISIYGETGTDKLVIDNSTCTQDFDTGSGYDSVLTMGSFTGQGMARGLSFDVETIEVRLGSGNDSLAFTSWIGMGTVTVDLGAGDDRLAIGNPHPGFGGLDQFSTAGITLIGGPGNDRLEFNDTYSYAPKTVGVSGRTVSGLMPGGASITLMPDFEAMALYLGEGTRTVNLSNPDVPTTVYTQGATIYVHALQTGGEITLFGSSVAPDYLIVGGTGYVDGKVVYTAGSVTYTQYDIRSLWTSGVVLINGGPGADWLFPTMDRIEGSVVFLGGEGEDRISITAPTGAATTTRFNRSVDPILGDDMAHIEMSGSGGTMGLGVWYSAELLYLDVLAYAQNRVYIDATSPDTRLLRVTAGSLSDEFYVGTELGRPLTDIHGRLELFGSTSYNANEANLLIVDNHDSTVGWPDIRITRDQITGMGLEGITYAYFKTVRVKPGTGSDVIHIDSVSTSDYSPNAFT